MAIYDDVKSMIEEKKYTVKEAQTVLNAFMKTLEITADQYAELYEMSKSLDPNTADDKDAIWKAQIESRVSVLEEGYSALKEAVESGKTEVTEPTTQAGTADDPITAARGMHYEKDKYYADPEKDNEIYVCTVTVDLNGMPHEFVNTYFNWYSMPIKKPDTGTDQTDNTDQTETGTDPAAGSEATVTTEEAKE